MEKEEVVKISDIVIKENLYPRQGVSYITAGNYARDMKGGAQFPSIALANLNGKKILIDGRHRMEAKKLNKETHIRAKIYTGLTEQQIYVKAIELNRAHGQTLSSFDKAQALLRLRGFKMADAEISRILQIPITFIAKFEKMRTVSVFGGKQIAVKRGVAVAIHDMESVPDNAEELQISLSGDGVATLAAELINLLEDGDKFISKDKKTIQVLEDLQGKLNTFLSSL